MANSQKIIYDVKNQTVILNGKPYSKDDIKSYSITFFVFGILLFIISFFIMPFGLLTLVLSFYLLLQGLAYNSCAKTLEKEIADAHPDTKVSLEPKENLKNVYDEISKMHFPTIFIPQEINECKFSKSLSIENLEIKDLITHDLFFEPEIIGHDVDFNCSNSNGHITTLLSYKGITFANWSDNFYCNLINETLNDKGHVLIKIKSIELVDNYSYEISCVEVYLAIYENPTYKREYFNVAGTSFRQKEISSLGAINNDYSISKKDAIDLIMLNEKIYQYSFSPQKILLIEEPDNEYDPNAIKVIIDDIHVGYIKKDDCLHVKELLNAKLIKKVTAEIHGGKYKTLVSDYDVEKDKEIYNWDKSEIDYFISIGIKLK